MSTRAQGFLQACTFSVLILCLSVPLLGQLYTGSISGMVTDPSGAVVPQAKVTALDTERQYAYTATTDATGHYVMRAIPPGQYTVSVEATGFNRYVRERFAVDVSAAVTVDASLQLKAGVQVVQVTDTSAPLLSTENAAIGQTIDRKLINDLPLIGRGVFDLVLLAPGITQSAGKVYGTNNGTTNWISNGTRNGQSDILLDGISMTNTENNGGTTFTIFTPTVDNVQEFQVQQGNFSAEFGLSGAAVVNAVSRSGSNQFHGSGYEFARNRVTDANDFFSNAAGSPLPPVHWHNFGGTVGGPIRRDKTFFFFDYDGQRSKSAGTGSGAVPTAKERAGDFSELCSYYGGTFDANGRCSDPRGQIWDPFTAQMKPDNSGWVRQNYIPLNNLASYTSPGNPASPQGHLPATPGNLLDPVAMKLMAYYPSPNLTAGTPGYDPLYYNWHGSGTVPDVRNSFDAKVDHQFNDNNRLSVKYSQFTENNNNGPNLFHNAGDTTTQGTGKGQLQVGTVNFVRTFSATTILSITLGEAHNWASNKNLLNCCYTNLSPVDTLGMPSYIATSGYKAFPTTYIDQGYMSVGNQAWSNYTTASETRHLLGSLTHIMGKHELKGGAELRLHYMNMMFNGAPAGIYNFSRWGSAQEQSWSGGSGGGNGLATFMMGLNDGWGEYEIPLKPAVGNKTTSMYAQDNWKITSKLTLNLGLRYDIELPRTERYNRMSYFDPNAPAPLTPVAALPNLHGAFEFVGVNGNGSTITPIYGGEIQPRFGFAYRLNNNTSIRGGYGIYYDQSLTGTSGLGVPSFNGFSAVTNNSNWGANGVPISFLRDPYPNGLNMPVGSKGGPGYLLGQTFTAPIPQWYRIPQEQSWSLGVQHQLPWSVVVEATYVGKKGTHLYMGGVNSLDYLPASAAAQFLANPAAATAQVANPLAGQPGQPAMVSQFQLWLPYPQYGLGSGNSPGVNGVSDPRGNSIYHGLQLKTEKRFSSGLQFLASYVWSKSIDDSSVVSGNTTFMGGSTSLQDPNNLHLERALSQFNIPQVLQFAWVYELPFGRGKRFGSTVNRFADLALGGWQFNGTYRWDDGQPLAITLANAQPLPTYGQRPNMLGELKQNPGLNLTNYFANPDVISAPAQYMFGSASRTDPRLRAPGTNVMAASMFKSFPLGFREGARLELRLELFNALNHPTFSPPNTSFGNPNFGKITSQANSPREGQLALKLYF